MEKNQVRECFCCKEIKEGSLVTVTVAEEIKVKNSDCDLPVEYRWVCKDCNHLNKKEI